ncbi:iron-containing redox enzyme family protein [Caenibius sp. WL]|uniref:iron-containing redox enzyme family protein n=1 Tax=Caenibius sp. WL TaxID=2872646 RepID=UPI001C99140E|nr:iron-containing redox enzyme family protein [Caenibius sp. WL]QZP08156.1 iron-containing redox enzyme family protein [Caenibius sp. WL]
MATQPFENLPSPFLSDTFQRTLSSWNRERLAPAFPAADWELAQRRAYNMQRLERAFLESLRAEVSHRAKAVPREPGPFMEWFENLKVAGPGQGDPLFPWLAEEADRSQICWILEQEAAGEAGFDDLVALTQVKLPSGPKLELARNYWDEMGRGNAKGMHGPMLARLVEALDLHPAIETTVWESLALANAMTAMATTRAYAWHSVGALGVIELTASGRSAYVAKALRRIGLSGKERQYFDLHAMLDIKHSADWNREAILPLVEEDPRRAVAIAEGALIRLEAGKRCFDRYRRALWNAPAHS